MRLQLDFESRVALMFRGGQNKGIFTAQEGDMRQDTIKYKETTSNERECSNSEIKQCWHEQRRQGEN
jgi:hypothetical protein